MRSDYPDSTLNRLAKRLGMPALPGFVRAELVEHSDDLIRHAHDGDDEMEDLEREARKILRLATGRAGHRSPPGRPPAEERPIWQLKEEEIERSWAFSEYVARIAATESEVQRFRSRYLGGSTIHGQQGRALLASPVAAIWPAFGLRVTRFSVLDHTHHIIETGADDEGSYSLMEAHDPATGITRTFKDRRPLPIGAWGVAGKAKDALSNREDVREIKGWQLLSFPHEEDGIHRVCVKPSSVLGELRKLTDSLVQRYPWWESETVWFVLTGTTPWVAPVSVGARGTGQAGIFERQFVTIKAEPWISEATILRTYREAQVRLLQGDNRPTKDKQTRLFRFVSSKTDPYGLNKKERTKIAKRLISEWDKENPDDAYGSDTRRFWRDYDRAVLQIAQPMRASAQRERERTKREHRRRLA
jgi:hypothetical protein